VIYYKNVLHFSKGEIIAMTSRRLLALLIILLTTALGQTVWGQEKSKEIVRVRGSESMTSLINGYANEFSASHPNCNLVISGGDFHVGLEGIIAGNTEVAMLSARPPESVFAGAKAAGLTIEEAVVGWGGIVIITNASNSIQSLTIDQAHKLLAGEYKNWSEVGGPDQPVVVVAINETVRAGTYKYLTEEFLHSSFASGARMVSYFRAIPPAVAELPGSIGLIRMRNLERLQEQGQEKTVKEVPIKADENSAAVMPTRTTIEQGTYPITRPYLLYVATNKANKCTIDFFRFCEARNPRPHSAPKTPK
jgi:phosphate transport system substrate-binding protein